MPAFLLVIGHRAPEKADTFGGHILEQPGAVGGIGFKREDLPA
jgi:hypothetical protein